MSDLYYAKDCIGKDVKNHTKEKLGEVNDMTICPEGQVKHLIISFGGLLGMGESLVAVPYEQCSWSEAEQCVVLNVSEEQLKNAPTIDKSEVPSSTDTSYFERVDRYYQTAA